MAVMAAGKAEGTHAHEKSVQDAPVTERSTRHTRRSNPDAVAAQGTQQAHSEAHGQTQAQTQGAHGQIQGPTQDDQSQKQPTEGQAERPGHVQGLVVNTKRVELRSWEQLDDFMLAELVDLLATSYSDWQSYLEIVAEQHTSKAEDAAKATMKADKDKKEPIWEANKLAPILDIPLSLFHSISLLFAPSSDNPITASLVRRGYSFLTLFITLHWII